MREAPLLLLDCMQKSTADAFFIVSVALVDDSDCDASRKDVKSSIERTAEGKAVSRQVRTINGIGFQAIWPQKVRFDPFTHPKNKEKRPKQKVASKA